MKNTALNGHDVFAVEIIFGGEEMDYETPAGFARCEAGCGTLYDPRREGNPPTAMRTPLCERCWRSWCGMQEEQP